MQIVDILENRLQTVCIFLHQFSDSNCLHDDIIILNLLVDKNDCKCKRDDGMEQNTFT